MTSPAVPAPLSGRVEGVAAAGPNQAARHSTGRRPPPWLWVAAILVLIPIALPIGGLVVRVLSASSDAASVLFSARTVDLLARSTVLTALVTFSAIVLGVGTAWIVVRTDLRGRTVWGVLVAMPLVIPSYVIALAFLSASGPRGLFTEATGIPFPVIDGLPGAWWVLTLSTYPYVFLIVAAALRRIDPSLEDAARMSGVAPITLIT